MQSSLVIVNFVLVFIVQNIHGDLRDQDYRELYNQDPNGSGVSQCRKCTLEFLKLDKAEQAVWTRYIDMHYTEFRKRFLQMNHVPREVVVTRKSKDKSLKDLYPEERKLLKWYYVDLKLSEEYKQDRIQKFSQTVGSIKGWQEFEKQLSTPDSSEPKLQIQPEIIVPIYNATLTKQERIEL